MTILIYTDNVSNNHILYYALARLRGKQNLHFVNANEILRGALTPHVDLFVMPGGASRYKSAKLNGAANALIKAYVAQGGRYLGICAGSYMACETTLWAQGTPYEIMAHNELGFFPGTGRGPVTEFGRGDNYNATEPRVVMLEAGGQQVPSLYMGGCTFESQAKGSYQVLARFAGLPDQPAAAVSGQYGQGRWLLSSTHPEYDAEAVELLNFDVVGNDYQEFSVLPDARALSLTLLDDWLHALMA